MTENNISTPAPIEMSKVLPILPISNAVLFPNMFLPLTVGGQVWVKLFDDAALSESKQLAVFLQSDTIETFALETLSRIGVVAQIMRMLQLPNDSLHVLLQGQARIQIDELISSEPYPVARVTTIIDPSEVPFKVEELASNVLTLFQEIVQASATLPDELAITAANTTLPGNLADLIAANLNLSAEDQQAVRDAVKINERLELVDRYLHRERKDLPAVQNTHTEIAQNQREHILRQQLDAIRRELGEIDEPMSEFVVLRRRLEEAALPEEPYREAEHELDRLERLPPGAAEASMIRTYLEWLIGLPWNKSTLDNFDLRQARAVLDADHYDLERIKDRVIEYLAVRKLQHERGRDAVRGPILCFVGPPGVGKTSLGQSIARALGRKFVRVALGGVRDELEIRGFRRTYIGAVPGRIIQNIRRSGSNNPVILLDEVDKLSMGIEGDSAAALLELLDPEQNRAFVDRYLDVPFDLSRVLFVCTVNRSDTIPPALLDRLEVLELAGYTEVEKMAISKRYIVPRQCREQGLDEQGPEITEAALCRLISAYTREAGVRNLERQIGAIFRKMATRLAEGQDVPPQIDADDLNELLEPPRFRTEVMLDEDEVGVATGLVWTPVGGDILFIEVSAVLGNGQLILTGQLGDVMRESALAALTYARSRAATLNLPANFAQTCDIHIHVPAGAIPKEGPSAGITIASALISALTERPVYKHVAMTGEVTLRGKVLPIAGVKEKVLAAQRAGIDTVLLPKDNEQDLWEIPVETREKMEIVLVNHMDEVLPQVLHAERE